MRIFLDIDGVMVPAKSWQRPEMLIDGFPSFSRKAIFVLQSLISDDTTIMLTTSHKAKYSVEEWKSIFSKRDINVENLHCLPANVNNLSRKDEIVNWFVLNNISDDFIILDDDKSLNELPTFLKDNLVQTSAQIGLTEEHLEIAKARIISQHISLMESEM